MRIVFYSHQSRLGSGGTESLLGIVSYLSKRHDCYVVTPSEGALNTELSNLEIKNINIPFKWTSSGNNKFTTLSKSTKLLKRWINNWRFNKRNINQHIELLTEFNPDIIYTNTSVINIGVILARKLGIKHVWHLREFQTYDLAPDFGYNYFSYYLKKSSFIIVNSNILKTYYGQFVNSKKIKLIYNGIENDSDRIDNFLKKENRFYIFLMVGTLIDYKGHLEGIKAIKELMTKNYKVQLHIVGEGPFRRKIEKYTKENDLDESVVLYGQQKNVESFYRSADCYLMCSKHESFGRVTVEAMLCGLPILAKNSQYNAAKELIRDGIDGWLYKEDIDLVEKMEWMLNNKEKSIEMGQSGHEWARNNFSLKRSVEEIEKFLNSLN